MRSYNEIVNELQAIAASPASQLQKAVGSGRKCVGVLPYFCPEELVYAAGALPVGLWGAQIQAVESKRYYPAFICSLLHTVLELGIRGALDGLSAVMIPASCDSLKGMAGNWQCAVPQIPLISFSFAQNRKTPAGVEFTETQLAKTRRRLEELLECSIDEPAVASAVAVYNENRAALRRFDAILAEKPGILNCVQRSAVFKAGYFMDRAEHTALVGELNAALEAAPAPRFDGKRIVLTGIMADMRGLLEIFDSAGAAVVGDQLAHESVALCPTPVSANPLEGMARRFADIEGASVLFDPDKRRCSQLAELARERRADGVVYVQTKFCDPEEYDYVPVKRALEKENIPLLQIEIDLQMQYFEQIRSAVETFCEII